MKGSKGALNVMAYIAFIVIALLILINNFLPVIGVIIDVKITNVLTTVQNVLVLIVLGILSYKFAMNSAKWVKIVYWIALVVFVTGTIILWA